MNAITSFLAVSFLIGTPVLAFSQSTQALTRAQVRAQLMDVEKAGYQPGATDAYAYPHNILAAEARVAGQKAPQTAGYGPVESGSSESSNSVIGGSNQ